MSNYIVKCKYCGYNGFENCGTHCSCCGTIFPEWEEMIAATQRAIKEIDDFMEELKSTHKCEVVKVYPEKHPNADKLEIVKVFGYTVVTGIGNFKAGDLGVYFPPDSLVPETKPFEFLWADVEKFEGVPIPERRRRIKARNLRGIMSEGLLLPLPELGFVPPDSFDSSKQPVQEGDDVAGILGVTHYDPVEPHIRGDCERAPDAKPKRSRYPRTIRGWFNWVLFKLGLRHSNAEAVETLETGFNVPAYEIDAYKRHSYILQEGEDVLITEKIHGSNGRFIFHGDRMYCGSHYQWKKNQPNSFWWMALANCPWIEAWCQAHPDYVVYGEVVPTNVLNYGYTKDKPHVFIFDIRSPEGTWLGTEEIACLRVYNDATASVEVKHFYDPENWVPIISVIPYSDEAVQYNVDGQTLTKGKHIREGIVIKPYNTRIFPRYGRVILKLISNNYLENA